MAMPKLPPDFYARLCNLEIENHGGDGDAAWNRIVAELDRLADAKAAGGNIDAELAAFRRMIDEAKRAPSGL